MSDFTLPAPDAAPEEWGRLATKIPGWRWMPGMRGVRDDGSGDRIMDYSESALPNHDIAPDPDDPATAGCLLASLGVGVIVAIGPLGVRVGVDGTDAEGLPCRVYGSQDRSLGRACIAAAAALGRWPGGATLNMED